MEEFCKFVFFAGLFLGIDNSRALGRSCIWSWFFL